MAAQWFSLGTGSIVGSITVVTGPTVVLPTLRHVRLESGLLPCWMGGDR